MSPKSFRLFASVALLPVFILTTGCSSGTDGNVVPVSGTVMYNGAPVDGAHVTFVSEESSKAAYGRTGPDGQFRLTTFNEGDGAMIGSHRVTIMKREIIGDVRQTDSLNDDDAEYDKYEDAEIPKTRSLVPDRYSRPNTSDLTASVSKGDSNHFPFDLAD